jgi:subtilisin family serine protease
LTGTGIKVAVIDTGVYYKHPALGNGFGPGFKVNFKICLLTLVFCVFFYPKITPRPTPAARFLRNKNTFTGIKLCDLQVAFGWDFVGDNYGIANQTLVPDSDPIDDCTSESHGTHVAGIVGADASTPKLSTYPTGFNNPPAPL